MTITTKTSDDGTTFYETQKSGVTYLAYANEAGWQVISRRIALGMRSPGTCRRFATAAELSANVKPFAGLDRLLSI